MVVRVAINGFGRIGRMVLKAGINDANIDFVAINDLTDTKTLAHLLKHDSAQGRFSGTVSHTNDSLIINGKTIRVLAEKDPAKLPWKDLNIDVTVESTGFFLSKEDLQKHINAGAKKVLLSAPPKDDSVKMFVKGVNEHEYNKFTDNIISIGSCTTNCLAPMVKVLNDNYGIEKGFITTIHAFTADQRLVDAPHKDLRRARAASVNVVPTSTGAAKAIGKVIPAVTGKMDGIAVRVPVITGSMTDLVCEVKKDVSKEEINQLFKSVSEYFLKGVLEYNTDSPVSSDIIGNPHSCIFDPELTNVINKRLIKVFGWYDNEWGYSNRMIDTIKYMM